MLGMVLFAFSIGSLLGPLISGDIAEQSLTWRWAFYANLLTAVVTFLAGCSPFLPSKQPDKKSAELKLSVKLVRDLLLYLFRCGFDDQHHFPGYSPPT